MDPQPFPRRFPREYQVDDEDHLQSRDMDRSFVAAPLRSSSNTRSASRDSTAVDISWLGVSPLSVHAKTGHVYFLQDPRPTPKMFHFGSEAVNVTGMSLSPGLGPEQDPLAGQELLREGDVNIFLTHYPIEGFEGYFGQETHIGKSSIPRNYQLFASGHLHRHQKNTINGTPVMYPGSTERVSFNEEGEEKGFCWLELDKTGTVHQEFHSTPARPMETLDSRVTGEGGSLTRQIQDLLEKRRGAEKILRIRVTGRVSLDQLSTYKRSVLQSYCQD